MSIVALEAQYALTQLKARSEEAKVLELDIENFKLKSEAAPVGLQAANFEQTRKAAQFIVDSRHSSAQEEQRLDQLVKELAEASDPAAQEVKLREIQLVGREIAEKKRLLAVEMDRVLVTANQLAVPEQLLKVESALALRTASLYKNNEASLRRANIAMDNMWLSVDGPAASTAQVDETKERLKFLEFLESHPLLESELSGFGLQISSASRRWGHFQGAYYSGGALRTQ